MQLDAKLQSRIIYAEEALKYIPQLFTLLDRNKFSPTYGCFDREFWHYKTLDFPCGMSQEVVLALALIYSCEFPNNIFYKKERVRELVIAAIDYAMRSGRADGSCDEYYPFERALGATAFSLYSTSESYLILKENNDEWIKFFKRRAEWLLKNPEVGVIANHEAISALALFNVYLITGDELYRAGSRNRIERALSCQSSEGWFKEYEGCDPGYLTWTIDFLATYFQKAKDEGILKHLEKAVEFAAYFIHPDGSFAGEYGSRDSYNFFPHGFEILGRYFPIATQICDKYLEGIKKGKRAYLDDQRIFGHHLSNYLKAYLDFNPERKGALVRDDFQKYFPEAGIYVAKKNDYYAVISLKKGGIVKLFKGEENIYNDSGFIGKLNNGSIAVSQLMSKKEIVLREDKISVGGYFDRIEYHYTSPLKLIIFRSFLLLFGFIPGMSKFVRRILQMVLIMGKKKLPINYERQFIFNHQGLEIKDTIELKGNTYFKELAIGVGQTSIYTAVSDCFQESVLDSWIDLKPYLKELNHKKQLTLKRELR